MTVQVEAQQMAAFKRHADIKICPQQIQHIMARRVACVDQSLHDTGPMR